MASIYKDNVDKTLLQKVLDDFSMEGKGPVAYCHGIEGQHIRANEKTYLIGPWAGPAAEVSNVFHEMGHFAEREIEKLKKFPNSGWGLYPGKFWQIGVHWGYEPQTDQSVRREQRVWAYQISLQKHYNLSISPYDTVSSATWLPAWCYYQPFPKVENEGLSSWDRRRLEQLAKDAESMSINEYTFEDFQEQWNKRIEILKAA